MSGQITPNQALILFSLLGRHGSALQKDILPKVEKKDREALVAAGFIAAEKRGSAFVLTAEDRGWRWAAENLRAELPRPQAALRDWLTRLDEHLARSGETLAGFVGAPPPKAPAPAKPKPKRKPQKQPPPAPSAKELRQRIEAAYLKVTGGRKAEAARLSKVRAELFEIDRKTVDAGLLLILQGDKHGGNKARLGRIADPTALSREDRDAAFSPAGEPFHLLWIQS